ncbi:YgaP family membrane protein [Neobacillus bataviensis]|uniref:YgaP family membrane protein n=1 Tax=Neobacillus bataviensis TaxID=220685 RepID=UPI001CBF2A43|nr:DUF2892 domain-containing protein [Neobacillus bataviensis]
MNIRPNIGILNALIRITMGLTILAWSTSKLVKHPWRDSYLFVALCGAMKVAEGIVRYCPITALCEKCQGMIEDHNRSTDSMDGMEGIEVPYNPT